LNRFEILNKIFECFLTFIDKPLEIPQIISPFQVKLKIIFKDLFLFEISCENKENSIGVSKGN